MTDFGVPLDRATGRPLPSIAEDWAPVFVGAFTPRAGAPDHIVVTASASASDPSTVGEMRFRLGSTISTPWPIYSVPAESTIIGQAAHADTAQLVTIEMRRVVGDGDLFMPLAAAVVSSSITVPTPPATVLPILIEEFSIDPATIEEGEPIAITIQASGSGSLVAQLERLLPGGQTWEAVGEQVSLTAGVATVIAAAPAEVGEHAYRAMIASDLLEPVTTQTVTVTVDAIPLSAPGAPENLTAEPNGFEQSVTIGWTKPLADPGNPAADSFQIRYRQAGATNWIETTVPVDPSTTSSTSINVSDADPGETWEYAVRFINATAPGVWAPEIAVSFPSATGTGRVTTTGGRRVTTSGGRRVTTPPT